MDDQKHLCPWKNTHSLPFPRIQQVCAGIQEPMLLEASLVILNAAKLGTLLHQDHGSEPWPHVGTTWGSCLKSCCGATPQTNHAVKPSVGAGLRNPSYCENHHTRPYIPRGRNTLSTCPTPWDLAGCLPHSLLSTIQPRAPSLKAAEGPATEHGREFKPRPTCDCTALQLHLSAPKEFAFIEQCFPQKTKSISYF